MDATKRCGSCEAQKPVSDFYRSSEAPDGLQWWCKQCMREKKRARWQPGSRNDRFRAYYEQNKETLLAQQYEYRAANRDAISVRNRNYREDEANKSRIRELHASNSAKRRSRQREALCIDHAGCESIDRRAVWGRDEGHCRIGILCDGAFVPFEQMHLDHVVPLSKGGAHCYANVQTACAPCNISKRDKVLVG